MEKITVKVEWFIYDYKTGKRYNDEDPCAINEQTVEVNDLESFKVGFEFMLRDVNLSLQSADGYGLGYGPFLLVDLLNFSASEYMRDHARVKNMVWIKVKGSINDKEV